MPRLTKTTIGNVFGDCHHSKEELKDDDEYKIRFVAIEIQYVVALSQAKTTQNGESFRFLSAFVLDLVCLDN